MTTASAPTDFTDYVRAHQRALARFAYLLTGDAHLAEDLVQSALAKVYRRWDDISRMDAPDAYVRRVMVNEHATWWRRAWRRRERTDSDLVSLRAPAAPSEARHDADLWARVQTLSPRQRAAIVLRFYEDLSEAQTAEILGCSVGSVKTHTSRALAALRRSMMEAPA